MRLLMQVAVKTTLHSPMDSFFAIRRRRCHAGNTLVEMMVAVAVIGILASIAVAFMGNTGQSVQVAKLNSDVKKLNSVVAIYVAEGGSLSGLTDPQAVLDKLKTTITAAEAWRHVGVMTGRGVDIRLVARIQTMDESATDTAHAIWNPNTQQFEVSTTPGQVGIARFDLDDSLTAQSYGNETRARSNMLYNGNPGWVWAPGDHPAQDGVVPTDYSLAALPAGGGVPSTTPPFDPTTTPGNPTTPPPPPPPPPPPTVLPTPIITPAGGSFYAAAFPNTVTISSNSAPDGSSNLEYYITHSDGTRSSWAAYSSAVAIVYGDTVSAQNQSLDPVNYVSSGIASETYVLLPPPTIAATMTAAWTNALGGSNLVDNIDNSNAASVLFTHGSPSPNSSAPTGNIYVPDGSFESPSNTTVSGPLIGTKSGTIGSWNYSIATLVGLGGASINFGTGGAVAPVDGAQVAKLTEPGLLGVISTVDLNQTISGLTLSANTTYTLTFDMAGPSNLIQLLSSASASLTVGGAKVASIANASLLSLLVHPNTMTPVELSFTTGNTAPTGALGIDFSITNLANVGTAILYLDEVQLASGSANSMTFIPASFSTTPDVSFNLGQLVSYDGVTFDNSSATGVTLHLVMTVSSQGSQVIPIDLNFTITTPGSGLAGNDSITLSNPTTNATITIAGVTYTLVVSLAPTDNSNGTDSGNTLTVYPGKSFAVQLTGMWQ